jgi:hypothetical protein
MPSWHGAQLKHGDNFTFTFSAIQLMLLWQVWTVPGESLMVYFMSNSYSKSVLKFYDNFTVCNMSYIYIFL